MAAKTRLGFEGYGVRRATSFAGKAVASVSGTLAATEAADLASLTATFVPSGAVLSNVATRCYLPNDTWGGGVYQQFNTRMAHKSTEALTSVQLVFVNWRADIESNSGNGPFTIRASVEYPAGTFTQVLFSGATSKAMADGDTLQSDAVTVSIPTATWFWVRTYLTSANGSPIIAGGGGPADSSLGDCYEFVNSGTSDKTMGGTIPAASTGGYIYGPCAIVGYTTKKAVALVGDSRPFGFYTSPASGDRGDLAPSVANSGLGYINLGINGHKAQDFVTTHTKKVALVNAYCTTAILEYGINDLNAGRSDAQLRTDLNTILGYFTKPTYLSTMEPVTSSTDSWATTGNQTTASYNASRIANNNWRRSIPAGFVGCFEVADVVETARDSGIWKAPAYTPDGVHNSGAAEIAIKNAGAITFPTDVLVAVEAPDIAAISGTFLPVVTGTLITTGAPDVAAFNSTFAIVGTLITTDTADVMSFTGSGVVPSGTLVAAETPDTAALFGSVGTSGALITTGVPDTAAFFGSFAIPSGILVATGALDTAAFAGSFAGVAAGTLVATEASDIAAFRGGFVPLPPKGEVLRFGRPVSLSRW